MITIGSDFSGVGAFNQALNRLGIKYDEIFACDKDKYSRDTFILNYGNPKAFPLDVYDREIPQDPLTIYSTSPPCQAFSLAGRRLGKEDKRGILFFNSHKFIKQNQPRYFIFENVTGLLSDNNGQTFKEWVTMLGGKSVNGLPIIFPFEDSVPYHIYYKKMNARNHGVPQNRDRIFIIGIRDDKDNSFNFPKETYLKTKLSDLLDNNVPDKYNLSDKAVKSIILNPNNLQTSRLDPDVANALLCPGHSAGIYKGMTAITVRTANSKGYDTAQEGDSINISQPSSQTLRGRVGKGVSQTLDTGCNLATIKNKVIRRMTPRECFRLMDFPEDFIWKCSDTQAYRQAGNSIVVKCLELIIKNLKIN